MAGENLPTNSVCVSILIIRPNTIFVGNFCVAPRFDEYPANAEVSDYSLDYNIIRVIYIYYIKRFELGTTNNLLL